MRAAAKRDGVSATAIQNWRRRTTTADERVGPKECRSTVLTAADEAIVVAFRRHTLLPLDDRLCGLQLTIPQLTRFSLHRCLQRHGISRLRKRCANHPPGSFPVDIAQVNIAEGKLSLFVAIDH